MLLAALLTITKKEKQPKCPSNDEWINKVQYTHPIKYYSAIKKSEVLIHATTRLNLENTVISEKSQIPKTAYCIIPFIENVQK